MGDSYDETLTIIFNETLSPGIGRLSVIYRGLLHDDGKGAFRKRYSLNDTRYYVSTLFRPTYARQVFPCWDEPNFKATFNLAVNVPRNESVISNMQVSRISSIHTHEERRTFYFSTTPPMSTYLIAFVVGEFEHTERKTEDGKILVRVFKPKGSDGDGLFACDFAVKCIKFYTSYYGVEYPLKKLGRSFIFVYNFKFPS